MLHNLISKAVSIETMLLVPKVALLIWSHYVTEIVGMFELFCIVVYH